MGEPTAPRPASIHDVARLAGVSVTTVSHALSGRRPVAAETVRRIRAIVPEVGYVPFAAARERSGSRTSMLGLVVPDIANSFFASVAIGAESAANDAGYGVVVGVSQCDVHRERRFYNHLASGALDGLVYIPGLAEWDGRLTEVASRFPVVVVDEQVDNVTDRPTVVVDNVQGGRLAGEHLLAQGHTRVAVFTGPPGLMSTEERTAGFRSVHPEVLVLRGEYAAGAGRTLAGVVARYHPHVTAVFAGNDLMAVGAIEGWRQLGLRVPHDYSLVGFDDGDVAARSDPPLTTVRQESVELGRRAVRLLVDHLDHGAPLGPERIALPVRMVVRASTRRLEAPG